MPGTLPVPSLESRVRRTRSSPASHGVETEPGPARSMGGMRIGLRRASRCAIVFALAAPGAGDAASDAAAARDASELAVRAAIAMAAADRAAAAADLDAAIDAAAAPALGALRERLAAADALLGASASDEDVVASLRRAVRLGRGVARKLAKGADDVVLAETRGGHGFHRPRSRVTLRVSGCEGEEPIVIVGPASADPAQRTVEPAVTPLRRGRFRIRIGPDVGGVRVTATACGVTRDWLIYAQGPRGALRVAPPSPPQFARPDHSLRAGVPAAGVAPLPDASADRYEIEPALPAGLRLDERTGAVTGAAEGPSPGAGYVLTARNRRGTASSPLALQVAPALPDAVLALDDGFAAEPFAEGLAVPSKIAFAPDGRLFFTELMTGNVRVVRADGTLVPEPFATVPVSTGGERGLLGIAFSPAFETDGHVYVFACTPADADGPERSRVLRLTAAGDTGSDLTVVVDDLPVANAQNGGALLFGPDGKLYVTVGDTADPALAQTDGSRAGRILRYEPDGSIPADNPIPGDPEWCRGLRNSFDLAFAPGVGSLFASENGPTAHDELDFIQKGRNYEWGAEPESVPGSQVGHRMVDWTPVIVPTGITFLARDAFGPQYARSLFVASYDGADVRRVVLSGPELADVDEEVPFARWRDEGIAHKPLDLAEGPDGSLYVSTFTAIWRISRY